MLLAGVMLKLGAYGFLRLVIPLFPDVWVAPIDFLGFVETNAATLFAVLAMLGIVLGAFAAYGQTDIKRLVAYSSVNHMGFVALGIAVMAAGLWARQFVSGQRLRSDTGCDYRDQWCGVCRCSITASVRLGMFLLAGAIYHKTHTRDLTRVWWVLGEGSDLRWCVHLHQHGEPGSARV